MTLIIEPLRKEKKDGTLYKRPPEIRELIAETIDWPFDQLIETAKITNRSSPNYIPSDVLVFHLRATKNDNSDRRFMALYNLVMERVKAACPRPNRHAGGKDYENAKLAEIRDLITEHIADLIFMDRHEYSERLDFLECRFDRAIRFVRIDKFKKVSLKEDPKAPIEYDSSGEVPIDVEEALALYKATDGNNEENLTYRINLRQAIDALPDKERKVIDLLMADIPIESTDPEAPSISKILDCVEKTVRNRRDSGYRKIRTAMNLENHDDQ